MPTAEETPGCVCVCHTCEYLLDVVIDLTLCVFIQSRSLRVQHADAVSQTHTHCFTLHICYCLCLLSMFTVAMQCTKNGYKLTLILMSEWIIWKPHQYFLTTAEQKHVSYASCLTLQPRALTMSKYTVTSAELKVDSSGLSRTVSQTDSSASLTEGDDRSPRTNTVCRKARFTSAE